MKKQRNLQYYRSYTTLLCFIITLLCLQCCAQSNDTQALLQFKSTSDTQNVLYNWNTSNCCHWLGVTCQNGRVSKLYLRGMNLTGTIEALTPLSELRVLILSNNNLEGTLPNFTHWSLLWLLSLSYNSFSGPIPVTISSVPRLWRLDLAHNRLTGPIPVTVNSLNRLLTLHLDNNALSGPIPLITLPYLTDMTLQYNNLSGPIPPLKLGNLTSFDASFNNLSGPIPSSLVKFGSAAFRGNVYLCGSPLLPCNGSSVPSHAASPMNVPSDASPPGQVEASPAQKSSTKLSFGAIIAIIIGDVFILLALALLLLLCYWRKSNQSIEDTKPSKKAAEDLQYAPSFQLPDTSEKSKLVFFSENKTFELEDLLRASAEMLGKGSFGTTYKAVLEDGYSVAVKRLKEVNVSGRKDFEQHMELIGKLDHPNIVALRAYYCAKDEKLLVYDYMPNGSVYNLLHGNRGPGRVPLDWTTRVKIAVGAARGLAYLHQACIQQKVPHGNIKSSNILLDKEGNACVGDFGLTMVVNPMNLASRLVGYRAPEHTETKKASQKADVYSFGVLLLELLTGRVPAKSLQDEGIDLPKWVQSVVREEWTAEVFDVELMRYKDIEEEMVTMLQIAMACVSTSPDQRPKMNQVVKMIEELKLDQSPLGPESRPASVSVSASPSVSGASSH